MLRVMRRTLFVVCAAIVAALFLAPLVEDLLFDSPLIRACEAALQDTLLAPATYRRVSLRTLDEPLPLDAYFAGGGGGTDGPEVRELMRRVGAQPVRHQALFTYEAANVHGTAVRRQSICSYDSSDGDSSRAQPYSVRIDGRTKTDRLLDAVRALSHPPR